MQLMRVVISKKRILQESSACIFLLAPWHRCSMPTGVRQAHEERDFFILYAVNVMDGDMGLGHDADDA